MPVCMHLCMDGRILSFFHCQYRTFFFRLVLCLVCHQSIVHSPLSMFPVLLLVLIATRIFGFTFSVCLFVILTSIPFYFLACSFARIPTLLIHSFPPFARLLHSSTSVID